MDELLNLKLMLKVFKEMLDFTTEKERLVLRFKCQILSIKNFLILSVENVY